MGKVPGYRRQRRRGGKDLAFVQVDGERYYLGRYGTPESRTRYQQILAGEAPNEPGEDLRVVELVSRFLEFAERYYRHPDGRPTGQADRFAYALRPLLTLYEQTRVSDFGPKRLKIVRASMISAGGARTYINQHVSLIRQMFRWAVGEELIGESIYRALQAVAGLKRGRSDAKEPAPVTPVSDEDIAAVRPYLSRQVAAMVDVQLLTAARPGEVVVMRSSDITQDGKVWVFEPANHKNSYRGHQRSIYLGPKAQKVLEPFLLRPAEFFLFSPQEAEKERLNELHRARKTPLSCGNRPGTNRQSQPERKPGDRYEVASYRRAIHRACKKAGIAAWSPHRLRHAAATLIRRDFGVEAAQAILGHRNLVATQLYAEVDLAKAIDVIGRVG